jgi:hypothetical protein
VIFRKKDKLWKGAKKIDKLVTGIIIGWAVASMVGLSKTNKGKKIQENISSEWTKIAKKSYSLFGQWIVKVLSVFNKK